MKLEKSYLYESGYHFVITIQTKDVETHSAMTDLPDYQRELILNALHHAGVIADKLLIAKNELGK